MIFLTSELANDFSFVTEQASLFMSSNKITRCKNSSSSFTYELDNKTIIRFPKNYHVFKKLELEKQVLEFIKNKTDLIVPLTRKYEGDFIFFEHAKIPGDTISNFYLKSKSQNVQTRFCHDLANIVYTLNSLTSDLIFKINLPEINKLNKIPTLNKVCNTLCLSENFSLFEKKIIVKFLENFNYNNKNRVDAFCHFDLMAKNIAFNKNKNLITGVYDFGDCGIGDVHQDFSQIAIDFDNSLLNGIIKKYNKLSGNGININTVRDYAMFSNLTLYAQDKDPLLSDAVFIKKDINKYYKKII